MTMLDTQRQIIDILNRLERLEKVDMPGVTGSWTPTYYGSSAAGVTTYSTQTGQYILIANACLFRLRVTWTNATGTGFGLIGLPFTAAAGADAAVSFYTLNVTFAGSGVIGVVSPATDYIFMASPNSNAAPTGISVEVAGDIIASGWFEIA